MKNNISIKQLLQLSNKTILNISRNLGMTWFNWETESHIEDARKAFKKGWKHTTLVNLSEKINIAAMLEILTKYYCIRYMHQENIVPNKPELGLQWYIALFDDEDCPLIDTKNIELCDGLWDLMIKNIYLMED